MCKYKYKLTSLIGLFILFFNSCSQNIDYAKKLEFGFRVDDYIFLKNKNKNYIVLNFDEYYKNGKKIFYEIVKEDSTCYVKKYDIINNLLLIKILKDYEYEAFFNYNFNKIDTVYISTMITHHYNYQTSIEINYDNQKYCFVFLNKFISTKYTKKQIEQFTYFYYLKGLIMDYEMYFDPDYITPFDESYNLLEYLRSQGVKVDEEFNFNEHLRLRGIKEDEYQKK